MKNISVHLRQFVVGSLHPKSFSGRRFTASEFKKWKDFITKELDNLSVQAFKSSLSARNHQYDKIKGFSLQVIELSNIIYKYLIKYQRAWSSHPDAAGIKQAYFETCLAFESFLEHLAKSYPAIMAANGYSDFILNRIKKELKGLTKHLYGHLQSQSIRADLLDVVVGGINNLIDHRSFNTQHESYLRMLIRRTLKRPFDSTDALADHLIANDFNLPEFFLFCVTNWSGKLTELDGLLEQKEFLLETKSHLFDVSLSKGLKFPFNNERLYNELNSFLSEKYAIVKERLKINRQLLEADNSKSRSKRVLINLSVAQLGLFIRLQVEKGILAKEHIGELFAFFARNFYTPNTDFISPESLQKKSSDVEHATAKKLKAQLIGMLNWLNTNYNLSNYN